MNTKDLEIFLILAESENMQHAAGVLDSTPGMVSKSLKRLETLLAVKLFARVGKNIKLNREGQKFITNARQIVSSVKQAKDEYSGISSKRRFTISSPSILLLRWASVMTKTLQNQFNECSLQFNVEFEQQALNQLLHGSADLALITSNLAHKISNDMYCIELGELTMQVAAARNHKLIKQVIEARKFQSEEINSIQKLDVTYKELLPHAFVSPGISPFCGQVLGIGCDGWRNDVFPRKLSMLVNDYSILGELVKSGQALAYIPDYLLKELNLTHLNIKDCNYLCQEKIFLVSFQQNLIGLFKK